MAKGVYQHKPHQGFQKGHIPFNKGKKTLYKCSDCSKELSRKRNRCQPCHLIFMRSRNTYERTLEYKKKISAGKQGVSLENWSGFISPSKKLLRDQFRKRVGGKVLERDDYTCQLCGERGGQLHVDHIERWADNEEKRFDPDNCRTLCQSCHYKITFGREKPKDLRWGYYAK